MQNFIRNLCVCVHTWEAAGYSLSCAPSQKIMHKDHKQWSKPFLISLIKKTQYCCCFLLHNPDCLSSCCSLSSLRQERLKTLSLAALQPGLQCLHQPGVVFAVLASSRTAPVPCPSCCGIQPTEVSCPVQFGQPTTFK